MGGEIVNRRAVGKLALVGWGGWDVTDGRTGAVGNRPPIEKIRLPVGLEGVFVLGLNK